MLMDKIKELVRAGKSPKEAIAESLSEKRYMSQNSGDLHPTSDEDEEDPRSLVELQEDAEYEPDDLASPLGRAIMHYVMKR